jgi:hypothetical protein
MIVLEAMMPINIFTQHCGSSMIIIIELPFFYFVQALGLEQPRLQESLLQEYHKHFM